MEPHQRVDLKVGDTVKMRGRRYRIIVAQPPIVWDGIDTRTGHRFNFISSDFVKISQVRRDGEWVPVKAMVDPIDNPNRYFRMLVSTVVGEGPPLPQEFTEQLENTGRVFTWTRPNSRELGRVTRLDGPNHADYIRYALVYREPGAYAIVHQEGDHYIWGVGVGKWDDQETYAFGDESTREAAITSAQDGFNEMMTVDFWADQARLRAPQAQDAPVPE